MAESRDDSWLQQYLPFTVLKPTLSQCTNEFGIRYVATVLTVYGIETPAQRPITEALVINVATVLTVYGIETLPQPNR